MAGSDSGASSTDSNASFYRSLHVDTNGDVIIPLTPMPVPENAPAPLADSVLSVYSEGTDTFYSIVPSSAGTHYEAARWDQRITNWVSDNWDTVGRALANAAPTLIQGAAGFLPDGSTARTVVRGAGIGLQFAMAGYDGYRLATDTGQPHPLRGVAVGLQGVSAAANLYSATGPAGTLQAGGFGTWTAAAGTVTNTVADVFEADRGDVYQQPANIPLQDLPAHMQPVQASTYGPVTYSTTPHNASNPSFSTGHQSYMTADSGTSYYSTTQGPAPLTTQPVQGLNPAPGSRTSRDSGRTSGSDRTDRSSRHGHRHGHGGNRQQGGGQGAAR